jgi:ribosomal protein S18 acetylase RimI-like enzyme
MRYEIEPDVTDEALNELFASAWDGHEQREFGPILSRSLTYVCAYSSHRLVGFVDVAWDGGVHGFVLDTTVARDCQRRGIGTELMRQAARTAFARGIEWLHVDFEERLQCFYQCCGYQPTKAGLLHRNWRNREMP